MLYKKIGGSLFGAIFNQAITFIVTIILARHVGPYDFGIIAVILSIIMWGQHLLDCGLSQGLILKKNVTEKDTNTFFWFSFLVGLILFLLFFFFAETICTFYKLKDSVDIVRALGAIFLFSPLYIVQKTLLTKDLRVKDANFILIVSNTIAGLIAIIMVMAGGGIWSLVTRQLILFSVSSLIALRIVRFSPSLQFSVTSLLHIIRSAGLIFAGQLLGATYDQIDKMFLAIFVPVIDIGFYDRGKAIPNLLSTTLSQALGNITMPYFVTISEDKQRVIRDFISLFKLFSYILIPVSCLLFLEADTIISVLLGEPWVRSTLFLKIMSAAVYFIPICFILTGLLNAVRHTRVPFVVRMFKLILFLLSTPLSYKFGGAPAVVCTIILINLLEFITLICFCSKILFIKVTHLFAKLYLLLPGLFLLFALHHVVTEYLQQTTLHFLFISFFSSLISLASFAAFILLMDSEIKILADELATVLHVQKK